MPAGTGTAHVVVTNGTVSSPQIPKDRVTYVRPAVTSPSLSRHPLYYVHDERGSTRALLDGSGAVAATVAYSPYGRVIARTGPMPAAGYVGAPQDPNGLVYLRHRYLDPGTATFLTTDPAIGCARRSRPAVQRLMSCRPAAPCEVQHLNSRPWPRGGRLGE